MQAAQIGLDAMVTSTTLESNMSDRDNLKCFQSFSFA